MNKIGLNIIISDRPEELERCLKSAQGFYDYLSICIVHFRKINKKKMAKVKKIAAEYSAICSDYYVRDDWKHPFIDDFATARNQALDGLPEDTDWVFILDTDDIMDDPIEARKAIMKLNKPSVITIRLTDSNKQGSLYQTRGWNYGLGRWEGRIHELMYYDLEKIPNVTLGNVILFHEPKVEKKHRDRNIVILEDVIKMGEATSREMFFHAELLYMQALEKKDDWREKEEEAVKLFTKLLDDKKLFSAKYKINCYLADHHIMEAEEQGDSFKPAINCVLDALAVSVFYPEPFFLMGKILYLSGKLGFAIQWLRAAIEMPETVSIWHSINNFRKSLAHEQLAFVFKDFGDKTRAFTYHATARALDKRLEKNDKEFGF